MAKIQQLPQQIDHNVTVNVPKNVEINYDVGSGWFIVIDGIVLTLPIPDVDDVIKYFPDVTSAMQYLIDRDLIVTKAYTTLDKAVKKVSKSTRKSKPLKEIK